MYRNTPNSVTILVSLYFIFFAFGAFVTFLMGSFCGRGPFVIGTFSDGTFCDGSFCDGTFCDGSFSDGSLYVGVPLYQLAVITVASTILFIPCP